LGITQRTNIRIERSGEEGGQKTAEAEGCQFPHTIEEAKEHSGTATMNFQPAPKRETMEQQVNRLRNTRARHAARMKKRERSDGGKVRKREFSKGKSCEVCKPVCERKLYAHGPISRRWACNAAYQRERRLRLTVAGP
jgi:hypothetical protein